MSLHFLCGTFVIVTIIVINCMCIDNISCFVPLECCAYWVGFSPSGRSRYPHIDIAMCSF